MDTLRRIQQQLLGRFPALRPGRFGWGAAQLSAASLSSRAIGFVYSAAVMRLAGPEAIGLFRLVWPLYATAFTVASAGVPYAMAKLLAERAAQHQGGEPAGRIAVQGLVLLAFNSVLMAAVMWWTAPWLVAKVGAEPRAAPIVRLLAPALPLACLAAGGRAMFESTRRMAIPAASLLAEQLALSATAIGLVVYLSPRTTDAAVVASALAGASVLGEAVGLLALALAVDRLWAQWHRGSADRTGKRHAPGGAAGWWPRPILQLALPVAAGRILSSVGGSLSTLLLPNRLQAAGLTASQAAAQVGLLRGVAFPLVLMPNMLSLALTTTLVPSISRALARGDRDTARAYADKALATTILFALPASAAFVSLPELWTRVLYGEESAAPLLAICGLFAPFIYLGQTLVGVLRGLGRPQVPVQSHLLGLTLETALVWAWVARPQLGIFGAALAAAVGYAAAYGVNQWDALQHLGTGLRAREFTVPLAAAVASGLAARLVAGAASSLLSMAGPGTAWASEAAGLLAGLAALGMAYGIALRTSSVWRWLSA